MADPSEAISLGQEARKEKNLVAARAHYVAAAAMYRDQNDSLAYAHTIRHVADMYLDESNFAEAQPLYEEALEIYRASLDTKLLDLANTVRPYALLHEGLGNVSLARELWLEARNLYASLWIEAGVEECGRRLARICMTILLAAAAFCAATAHAQAPATNTNSDQTALLIPTIKTTTRLVDLDVVVTDPKGRPVTGLKQEDFSVEEDKTAQTVRSFEVHTAVTETAYTVPKVPPLPPNTFLNLPKAAETATPTVILYDALNSSFTDQAYGQEESLKFMMHRAPGTQVAIFVLATKLYLVQGLNEELVPGPELQKKIQHFVDADRWNRPQGLDKRVQVTLSALTQVGHFLSALPGRKNLIWYSSGFPENILPTTASPYSAVNYSEPVRQATDLLKLSQVAVYPVDIRGVRVDPLFSAARSGSYGRASYGSPLGGYVDPITVRRQRFLNLDTAVRATMDTVADDTGGHAFYGTNDLEESLNQAITAGSTYYSLSYAPTNPKYDGSLRHIRVTLRKPGYTLAYRRTYFADDLDAVASAVADAPPSPLLPALERGTPLAHGLFVEAHLDAAGGPIPATPEQMQVLAQYRAFRTKQKPAADQAPVMMQQYVISYGLVARQLEMPPSDDGANGQGMHRASLEFGVISYDEDGRKLYGLDTLDEDTISADRYAKLTSDGYRATQTVFVPVTAASIRLAVRDVRGDRVGSLEVKLPLTHANEAKGN